MSFFSMKAVIIDLDAIPIPNAFRSRQSHVSNADGVRDIQKGIFIPMTRDQFLQSRGHRYFLKVHSTKFIDRKTRPCTVRHDDYKYFPSKFKVTIFAVSRIQRCTFPF